MTRHRLRFPFSARTATAIAAMITAAVMAAPAMAQNPDWQIVENPYQEDIEYSVGETHTPMVQVEGVRWRSFSIERPDFGLVDDDEIVDTDVILEFENRRDKSVRILVILLLEDENGAPLDRIEAKSFKLAAGRLKERKENAKIQAGNLKAAQKVYLFFEVLE